MMFEALSKALLKSKEFRQKLCLLLVIAALNILAIYAFQGLTRAKTFDGILRGFSDHDSQVHGALQSSEEALAAQLNSTQEELQAAYRELRSVRKDLKHSLEHHKQVSQPAQMTMELGRELQEFVTERKHPLGRSITLGIDTMLSSVGHACLANKKDLDKFMDYQVGGVCPDDDNIAQRLLLKGCEPLPRRRCFARGPANATEPFPFPKSTWTVPPDDNIHWSAYKCKSFKCLNNRTRPYADCKDCFDLEGREKSRWVEGAALRDLDFSIKEVVEMKNGGIRIGLDLGGGTATFSVRMREHNVTIVTTTLNLGFGI